VHARVLRVIVALTLLLAAAEAISPRVATPGGPEDAAPPQDAAADPPPSAPEGCLADVPDVGDAFPVGHAHDGRSLRRVVSRNVTLDPGTVFAVMALARATGENVSAEDAISYRETRDEVCAFNLTSATDRADVLAALALGQQARGDPWPANATLLVAFHTETLHEANLTQRDALAAIALASAGVPVRLADVMSVRHETRTVRTFDRVVSWTAEETLVALALAHHDAPASKPAKAAAPHVAPSIAPPSTPARPARPPKAAPPAPSCGMLGVLGCG
jgi:hypothetical protein